MCEEPLFYAADLATEDSETTIARRGRRDGGMEKLAQNIQEAFLNNARKDKIFLTIYLMSGVKLSGRIRSFDKYSVVLESNNQEQLIFKHAISTVVVSRPFHTPTGVGAPAGVGASAPGQGAMPAAAEEAQE